MSLILKNFDQLNRLEHGRPPEIDSNDLAITIDSVNYGVYHAEKNSTKLLSLHAKLQQTRSYAKVNALSHSAHASKSLANLEIGQYDVFLHIV